MYQHLFHLARKDGGFTFYNTPHHLAALYYLDAGFVLLLLASSAAAGILLVLLPTLKRRCTTLALGISALWTGAAIGYCILIPEWQVGTLHLPDDASLSYYSPSNVSSNGYSLGLGVGLRGANITFSAYDAETIYYDETLSFEDTLPGMRSQYSEALVRGMPTPVLSLFEQVAASGDQGFTWPFYVRRAGFHCTWALYFATALWMYALVLHCCVPGRSAEFFAGSGVLILAVPIHYHCQLLGVQDHIFVSGVPLLLRYGACFYTCVFTGVFATSVGCTLFGVGRWKPTKTYTAFSMDEWLKSQKHRPIICLPEAALTPDAIADLQHRFVVETKL